MLPRAFVVMPYGQRLADDSKQIVDFERVYSQLLEPALKRSGYEVIRADSQVAAGDIRTEMFFDLVTADLVVADVSISNENVYYELGVRDGVRPDGVLIVKGSVRSRLPFDIAPDRSFTYDSTPFLTSGDVTATSTTPSARTALQPVVECEQLANTFKQAIAAGGQTIGSPVYAQLPGIKPVNWDNIETSKAKYLNALQNEWQQLVRSAQSRGRPGDILTLAMHAPTRFHECQILYDAATALISLSRYSAAEKVLRDVIHLNPDHADAQIQLADVLSKLDEADSAERLLRKLWSDYTHRPETANSLGQVLRYLWHLSWKRGATVSERQKLAKDSSEIARVAVRSFVKAHRADPNVYYAGFNALMLIYLLNEVGAPDPLLIPALDELKAVTRYVASNQREEANSAGQHELEFWATTTLGGILFLDKQDQESLQKIREACAIRTATSFQLRSFLERLELLDGLGVRGDFVASAKTVVTDALRLREGGCGCHRVFLFSGYPIDPLDRSPQRFPAASAAAVEGAIETVLGEWGVSNGDLAICGGMNEGDIIFAQTCLRRGATVRILIRDMVTGESDEPLWPFTTPEWHQRFHQLLLDDDRKQIWFDTKQLGSPVGGPFRTNPIDFVKRRHTQWLINTAETEAEVMSPSSRERLYGLFLWDGKATGNEADDISFLIRRVSQFNGYQGQVKTINPVEVVSSAVPAREPGLGASTSTDRVPTLALRAGG